MAKISDRLTDVAFELGNRADIQTGNPSQLANWYKNAYISIGMGYPFEQLENTFTETVSSTNEFVFPSTSRAVKSLVIYDQNNSVTEPEFKDIRYFRRVDSPSVQASKPSVYTLYGSNILFTPAFDDNSYTLVLDTWEKPTIAADVVSTVLNVPDDWLEAIDYACMMRGHAFLGERDKARELRALLFGAPDPTTGAFIPGLLTQLATRWQQSSPARDYGISVRSTRQGYTK